MARCAPAGPPSLPTIAFPHKIQVPQRPEHLISRRRLLEILQPIVEQRLVTLIAPAGYGKTSLLTDFASAAPLSVCWYTLDRFDTDPWVFLSYLAAAIEQRFPEAMQNTSRLLTGQSRPSFATVAATLIHDIYAIAHDFVLIIDDWHLVDSVPESVEIIAQLSSHCVRCHLILASRTTPKLPDLMLLASRRQLTGLDEDVLRFTPAEVLAVLGADPNADMPLGQVQHLVEQSNGWITGILFVLQASGATSSALAPPDVRAGRQVYHFLAEQVFEQQSPEIRAFLLNSALLQEVTPETCDTVFARNDSGQMLATLLHKHLFITEIKPGVLRYHPLFREFLHEQYRTSDPQGYRSMGHRVADMYLAQEQWPLAFDIYCAIGDLPAAQQVISVGGNRLYTLGRLETLEHWFAALPLEGLDAPLLCLKARVLLDRGHPHEARVLTDLAKARMHPGEEPIALLLQAQLARIEGNYEQALDLVQRVLGMTDDPAQRAGALRTLGICNQRLGRITPAIEYLDQALAIERQRGELYMMAHLQHDLGVCYEELGRLQTAETYYSVADAHWATIGHIGMRSVSLNSKGVVQHLSGRYMDAHATLIVALEYARKAAIPNYQAMVLASLGDLYSDLQLWAQAQESYREARQTGGSGYLLSYLDLARVRLLVRQHHYRAAQQESEQLPETTTRRHPHAVLLLRAGIACGLGDHDQAEQLVQQALVLLERGDSLMDLARAYLLQAQIAASALSVNRAMLVTALDRVGQVADQLGHDAFLVAETLHLRGMLRHTSATGWSRAADWQRRHQMLLQVARQLAQNDPRPLLSVRALGTDQLTFDGQPVDLGWGKAREVLYYLLAHPNGTTPDVLGEAIWPNLSADRSRGALKAAIFQLRTVVPRELIALQGRQLYQLNREVVRVEYDVEQFLDLLDRQANDLESLLAALDLYHGPYLPRSDNEWSRGIRMYLDQRYRHALQMTAARCEQDGAYQDALILYHRLLAEDALDEAAHASVMRCYYALGNRAAAIDQYRSAHQILVEELGIEPESTSEIERLYSRIISAI